MINGKLLAWSFLLLHCEGCRCFKAAFEFRVFPGIWRRWIGSVNKDGPDVELDVSVEMRRKETELMAEAGKPLGSCCDALKEALEGDDFEALITVGPDEIIYITVGLVAHNEDEPALVDHPLFFCPFCGTKLQTPDEVKAKACPPGEVEGEYEPRQA